MQADMLRELGNRYRSINGLVMAITTKPPSPVKGCDDQFEFALDLMLDGLERLRDRA